MSKKEEQWHLSKTVNISHLATTVILVLGAVSYIGEIERSVAIQKTEIQNIKDTMKIHRSRYDEMFTRIDEKLDRLFELIHKDSPK